MVTGRGGRIAAGVSGLVAVGVFVTAGVLSSVPAAHPIATIRVVDETYRIELANAAALETAQQILAGEIPPMIPNGRIVRDDPGPNAPWSWHIDPASLEWADMATEVCDGLPEYVEDGTLTSDWYCPWSAEVLAIE